MRQLWQSRTLEVREKEYCLELRISGSKSQFLKKQQANLNHPDPYFLKTDPGSGVSSQ